MALRQLRIGSLENIHQYDDGVFDKSIEVEDPIKCTAPPVAPTDVVRLQDIGILYPVSVTDVDNPTELALIPGTDGMLILAYKVVALTGLNEYTLYTYDASGPALNSPYIVDAAGVADERWIAIGGKYRIFTIMNTLTTKNPPIDADKVVYRDSTASDVLVTSTWTQVKAFLKTYFDTLYGGLGLAHTRQHSIIDTLDHTSTATSGRILKANANGLPIDATNTDAAVAAAVSASHTRSHAVSSTSDHSDVNLAGLSNEDLMQWDDPSSKWIPKSIAEVVSGQNIAPGTVTIGTVEDWRYAAAIADDGTKALPTIKANYAAKVEVIVSSAGAIDANATFMIDSTGTVTPQVDSGNCVYNIDTDVKLCIGTAAAQNPLTIKYRLGSAAAYIMITMKYVKA
jgi:hypothetical protein